MFLHKNRSCLCSLQRYANYFKCQTFDLHVYALATEIGMENGELRIGNGELRIGNGELRIGNGELRMENGELGIENWEWFLRICFEGALFSASLANTYTGCILHPDKLSRIYSVHTTLRVPNFFETVLGLGKVSELSLRSTFATSLRFSLFEAVVESGMQQAGALMVAIVASLRDAI